MKYSGLIFASPFLAVASAFAGDIAVGPRVELAPDPPDARDQIAAKAAFDGGKTYLVVWQQGRDFYETETSDILAVRVSADGKPLDGKPIVVCAAADSQLAPAAAFAGGAFLVVWSDLRNGKDFDIYAARVTPDGKVLDKDGFLVAGGERNQYGAVAAASGGKFLVAWQDYRDGKGYAIHAARVNPDGQVMDIGGVPVGLPGKPARGGETVLAGTGKGWFLFWRTPEAGWKTALARLEEKGGALAVAEINGRLPVNHSLHNGQIGGAASDDRLVVCAGTGLSGRGGGNGPGTVLVFDVSGTKPLRTGPDNSAETVHVSDPGLDGPLAVAAGGGTFLMAAKGSSKAKAPYRDQIHGALLDSDGRLIGKPDAWHVLDEGSQPCSGPALAGGKDGSFLLVYSVDGGSGKRRLVGRLVTVK